jgi:hypothetical protein
MSNLWYCPAFPVERVYFPRWEAYAGMCENIGLLIESLKADGMRNPIFGQVVGSNHQVGPGKQRYAAARLLGWGEVPILFAQEPLLRNVHKQEMDIAEASALLDDTCELQDKGAGRIRLVKTVKVYKGEGPA